MTFAPATTETFEAPVLRLWQAICSALVDAEHAESMVRLGPLKSNQCEILFESIETPRPVTLYGGATF